MYVIKPIEKVNTEITIPSDKSISHRAAIISSIAKGTTVVDNFLQSEDTQATLDCLKRLGVEFIYCKKLKRIEIKGEGLYFPRKRTVNLEAKNSATTMRILSGLLVAQKFSSIFSGSSGLKTRPMGRITIPLRMMGANIQGIVEKDEEYPPLNIQPTKKLFSLDYSLPIASAQVKSAIIFASLYAQGITRIKEPYFSRDHTERMLTLFKAHLKKKGNVIFSKSSFLISPERIFVPGDFSSASYFILLGTLLKNSSLLIKEVGINPTRIAFLEILKKMGARITLTNMRRNHFEPYADISVTSSSLRAKKVKEATIPLMIDEVPLLMVAMSFAQGTSYIYGVKELKVKETDRIHSMIDNLRRAGVEIVAKPYVFRGEKNWFIQIRGGKRRKIKCLEVKSFSDHRTAMSMIVFALGYGREGVLDEIDCIKKSFPQFISLIEELRK